VAPQARAAVSKMAHQQIFAFFVEGFKNFSTMSSETQQKHKATFKMWMALIFPLMSSEEKQQIVSGLAALRKQNQDVYLQIMQEAGMILIKKLFYGQSYDDIQFANASLKPILTEDVRLLLSDETKTAYLPYGLAVLEFLLIPASIEGVPSVEEITKHTSLIVKTAKELGNGKLFERMKKFSASSQNWTAARKNLDYLEQQSETPTLTHALGNFFASQIRPLLDRNKNVDPDIMEGLLAVVPPYGTEEKVWAPKLLEASEIPFTVIVYVARGNPFPYAADWLINLNLAASELGKGVNDDQKARIQKLWGSVEADAEPILKKYMQDEFNLRRRQTLGRRQILAPAKARSEMRSHDSSEFSWPPDMSGAQTKIQIETDEELRHGFSTIFQGRKVYAKGLAFDRKRVIENYFRVLRTRTSDGKAVVPPVLRVYLPVMQPDLPQTVEQQRPVMVGNWRLGFADAQALLRRGAEEGLFELVELNTYADYARAESELGVAPLVLFNTLGRDGYQALFVSEWRGISFEELFHQTDTSEEVQRIAGREAGKVMTALHNVRIVVGDPDIDELVYDPDTRHVMRVDLEDIWYTDNYPSAVAFDKDRETEAINLHGWIQSRSPIAAQTFLETYQQEYRPASSSEMRAMYDLRLPKHVDTAATSTSSPDIPKGALSNEEREWVLSVFAEQSGEWNSPLILDSSKVGERPIKIYVRPIQS
ncbi:MAG: hypothetical protein HYZ84_03045, partial [Candidatus Omnitrophica bacterium]|nr:hypothetical protein [Candidatus Omnitrophota bacterium]